jgi:multiple sugar transport system permease protein
VLVGLTILTTLTVNPLAAYALSRFQLRATNQILIFLLATMAFPPAVSMIPAFLLLRDLHLLNTFFALVLPGAANGFSIFLLKGFFDSLPKELYEAASIDGASELNMFTTITLPLCKPILAVIALNAFIGAYGGFMWAFLSCQDERMWTLMVWLYQFQQMYSSQPYMVMAALALASLPTFLIFLTCQKIILRGIIIPSMK